MEDKNILTVAEVAKYLRVSESKIRKMVACDEIPYFRIGKRILFDVKVIQVWINDL